MKRDSSSTFRQPFLTVPQVVWWVLTRDTEGLDHLAHTPLFGVRRAYFTHEIKAASSGNPCHPRVAEFTELLETASIDPSQIEQLRTTLRKKYWMYGLVVSQDNIENRVLELQRELPHVDVQILRASLAKHSAEFHLRIEFFKAQRTMLEELARGSISATGRKNRQSDRTAIDRGVWPDYHFVDIDREASVLAVPKDPKQFAIAYVCASDPTFRPRDGTASLWADVLFDSTGIESLWAPSETVRTGAKTRASSVRPDKEQKYRDVHSRLQHAIRLRWSSAETLPPVDEMAEALAADPVIKTTGYKYETLRKMIRGTYRPFQVLGLPAVISGTNTGKRRKRTAKAKIPAKK